MVTLWEIGSGMLRQISVIVLLVILLNRVIPWLPLRNRILKQIMLGVMFGIAGFVTIRLAPPVIPGESIDMTVVLAAMAGVLGGAVTALIAALLIGAGTLFAGWTGFLAAAGAIFTASLIGIVYDSAVKTRWPLSSRGAAAALGAVLSIEAAAWSLLIPGEAAEVGPSLGLALLLAYPLGTTLLHYIVQDERKRNLDSDRSSGRPDMQPAIRQMRETIAEQAPTAWMLISADNLPNVNRLYGQHAGSRLMAMLTERILKSMPPTGKIGSIAEDKLIVSLPGRIDETELLASFGRKKATVTEPFGLDGTVVKITVSASYLLYTGQPLTAEAALQQLEAALRIARENGDGGIVAYDEQLAEKLLYRTKLEESLRLARFDEQFHLVYQPQFDIGSGRMRGFEALLRWRHPQLGNVPPVDFIPIAEENETIVALGDYVLREACRMHKQLLTVLPDAVMSVNLSPKQLRAHGFCDKVKEALRTAEIAASSLEFEITESTLMASFELARSNLNCLRKMGVRIALDDFGTGYSSLHYIRELPVELVKLDRSFVNGLHNPQNRKVLQGMIRFLKQLDYTVIAEGVESEEQLVQLKSWDCDIAQGYWLSKPIEADRLIAYVRSKAEAYRQEEKKEVCLV